MANFMNKIVNYQKPGPGVSKKYGNEYSALSFWRIYKEKFFKLLGINLMYVCCLVIVGLLCWLPMNKLLFKESYLNTKLSGYELHHSYVSVIKNFSNSFKFTDEEVDKAVPHFAKALDVIKSVNPDAITDGVEGFKTSLYSESDNEAIYSEMKLGMKELGFFLTDKDSNAEGVRLYSLANDSETEILEVNISEKGLSYTDKLPASVTDLLLFLLCLCPIILLGPVNLAATRLTRDYVQGNPSFMFADIWDTIKRNWWQGFVISALQYLEICCVTVSTAWYYIYINSGFFFVVGFSLCLFIAYIFVSMNFYVGIMQVTLDMNLRKILKNAFFFTVIAMGKNVLMILALIAIILAIFALIIFGLSYSLVMSLTVTMILIIPFSFWFYFVSFNTYPRIKKHIIDPYYAELKANEEQDTEKAENNESVSTDDADDEPEYVYHNGRMVHRSVLEQETLFNDNTDNEDKRQ